MRSRFQVRLQAPATIHIGRHGKEGLALRGTLREVLYLGATREFHVDLDGGERGVETPNDGTAPQLEPGAVVWLAAPFENCRVLRA